MGFWGKSVEDVGAPAVHRQDCPVPIQHEVSEDYRDADLDKWSVSEEADNDGDGKTPEAEDCHEQERLVALRGLAWRVNRPVLLQESPLVELFHVLEQMPL